MIAKGIKKLLPKMTKQEKKDVEDYMFFILSRKASTETALYILFRYGLFAH